MSYEGYYVHLCEKGHKWRVDASINSYGTNKERQEADTCPTCGTHATFAAEVDETNGIDFEVPLTQEPKLIETGFTETECKDHRGNIYFVKHTTYAPLEHEIGTRWVRLNTDESILKPVEGPPPLYPLNEVETKGYHAFLRARESIRKGENLWLRVSDELELFLQEEGSGINMTAMENFFRGLRYGSAEKICIPICSVDHMATMVVRVKNPVLFTNMVLSFFSENQYSPEFGAEIISLEHKSDM